MTRLFFQSLCHALSYVAALMVWQQAGKKHPIVFKSLPIHSKITSICGYLKSYFYPQICIMRFLCSVNVVSEMP